MVPETQLIPLLVACIPDYRDRLAQSVEKWLNDDGSVSIYSQLSELVDLVVERFNVGNYDGSDELFALVERVLVEGSDTVRDAVATGFLEGLQNQTRLAGEYWAPLLGERAKEFCRGMDGFFGVKTGGLHDVDIDTSS